MFQNLFFNWLAKMVGGRLDGSKLRIGAVLLFLYGVIEVLQKIFPDQVPDVPIRLSAENWDIIINYFKDGIGLLGGASASVGVVHKAYKEGLDQLPPSDVVKGLRPEEEEKKRSGKIPGQFP